MRRWWLAALLSLLTPGLGQVYNGQIGKGAGFIFCLYAVYLPAAIWCAVRFPSFTMFLALISGFVMILLGMIGDAIFSARRIGNQFVPKSYNRVSVYLVVIIAFQLVSTLLADTVREKWVQAYKIPSSAMEPTLLVGDHVFVEKGPISIQRGDILVFEFPEDQSKDFIKRVVGIPGDTMEIREKKVIINGTPLSESYVRFADGKGLDTRMSGVTGTEAIARARDNMASIHIPEGKYFVMGDNRDRSYDSRFWGFVDRSKVKGIAGSIYYSWDKDNTQVRWSRIGIILGPKQI